MKYMENLLIYAGNLSPFYVFSVVLSLMAVLLTVYLGLHCNGSSPKVVNPSATDSSHGKKTKHSNATTGGNEDTDGTNSADDAANIESVGQLRFAKYKSIEKSLTEEQRQKEREIERAQLAAIFELLKQQTENTGLNEEDLKEQLSLYR